MLLKHPVHFVALKQAIWPELQGWDGSRLDDDVLTKRSGGILHSWVLRTYYQLRLAGADVTLSDQLRPEAINIVSVRDFGRAQRDLHSFILVPQGDAHHSRLANFRILQNAVRPCDANSAVIWHWPQPGIIKRDPDRRARVEQLCYKGRVPNLDEEFRSESFISELADLEMHFEIDAYTGLRGGHHWNDYRHADAVLAVRNLTLYNARKKPASKLVNAWIAEVPALLGPEPAYRELGIPGSDYIEVRTPRDALEALTALRDNPEFFQSIVSNGRRLRVNYGEQALTDLWIETLNGPVAERFLHWHQQHSWMRAMQTTFGMALEPRAKSEDKKHQQTGARLLDSIKESV
ncbi:MAG: glycosyltransferase [Tateyamaria sp.]|uniref:glycosyltransferase n=1 Tax=Tateyamaria sp. TaxID=1929288 RepID=UPI00329FA1AA